VRIATTELTPVEQTAFLTEYARALDSQWSRPILGDRLAHEVVGKIDYDFAGLGVQTSVVCQTALRANVLRDRVLPAAPRSHSVPVSLAGEHWPDDIPADRPIMLVADGLFAFLSEPVIAGIFRRITDHFGSGELAFNDYGGIGWFSRLAIKLAPQKTFKDVGSQWGYPGFKDAHHPETWNPRMTLVEEASLAHAPEVDLFPGWIRAATKLSGRSKAGARKARILSYAF
jgi:O-methyltransferase involved in polyketide biosynthesis